MGLIIFIMFVVGFLGYFSDDRAHIIGGTLLMVSAAFIGYLDYSHQDKTTATEEQRIDQ